MSSRNEGEIYSETIPFDLIIEILTRLPAKSMARFRCVSKLWGSSLRSPSFTKSFFTISLSSPKLLFTCLKRGETFFFTSSRPHNSSTLTANFHMKFKFNDPYDICRPVRGLVCGNNIRTLEANRITVPLVCNPSTGQILSLPKLKTIRKKVISYLGYDPINKEFKVLCMTKLWAASPSDIPYTEDHQLLTLGTGKELSWRKIKCDITHITAVREGPVGRGVYDNICINGVLYYVADVYRGSWSLDIVCFDIRSERFKCISKAPTTGNTILVNYMGKLAMLQNTRICNRIQLCVLEDAEKHEWSSYFYVMPPPWKRVFENNMFYFVGTTSRGEIVLSLTYISESFYMLYYNPEKNNITRVEIQGMEAFKNHTANIFLDHIEDVKLMEAIV